MSSYCTDKDTSAPFNGGGAAQHLPMHCERELPPLLQGKFINGVGEVWFQSVKTEKKICNLNKII